MPHAEKGRVAWKYDENKSKEKFTKKIHDYHFILFDIFQIFQIYIYIYFDLLTLSF